MKITEDNNWNNFVELIMESNIDAVIPQAYFNHFYWGKIAEKAAVILQKNNTSK
ncbi:MAG: hypothetical protein WDM90_23610 [Ferruginibacter sp.]